MTDQDTMHVARIQLGVVGTDPTGKPIEMVIVEYSLGNGYHATVDWEFDADDRAMAQQLADHYEPKIKEMQQGNQSFQPTAQTLGFEPDKATP